MESVPQLSEPSRSLFLPQSGLPAEAQAAGGGGAPPPASPLPPVWTRARLQANQHTCTRWSPPFTKGLVGGELPGGVLETSCIGQPGAAPGRAIPLGSQPLRGAWEGSGRGAGSQTSRAAQDNHRHILRRKKEGPRPPRPTWIPPFSWRDSIAGKLLPQMHTPSPVLSVSLVIPQSNIPHFPPIPSIRVQTTYRRLFSVVLPTG